MSYLDAVQNLNSQSYVFDPYLNNQLINFPIIYYADFILLNLNGKVIVKDSKFTAVSTVMVSCESKGFSSVNYSNSN